MSTTYTASLRGKLVTIPQGTSARIYETPTAAGKLFDFIPGPETVGTATGNITVANNLAWIEVIRVIGTPLLTIPSKIYLLRDGVQLMPNPSYDPSTDLDRPADSDSSTAPKTTGDYDTGSIGEVVIVKDKTKSTTTPTIPTQTTDGSAQSRQWLKYGLYAVLGLAVITLVVLLAKPDNSVSTNQSIKQRHTNR